MFVRVKKIGTYRYLQIAGNRREEKHVTFPPESLITLPRNG